MLDHAEFACCLPVTTKTGMFKLVRDSVLSLGRH